MFMHLTDDKNKRNRSLLKETRLLTIDGVANSAFKRRVQSFKAKKVFLLRLSSKQDFASLSLEEPLVSYTRVRLLLFFVYVCMCLSLLLVSHISILSYTMCILIVRRNIRGPLEKKPLIQFWVTTNQMVCRINSKKKKRKKICRCSRFTEHDRIKEYKSRVRL